VHVAPAYVGSDHFGSYVHNLSLDFCKRVFPGLEGTREKKGLDIKPPRQGIWNPISITHRTGMSLVSLGELHAKKI
jgi:hypothetical protein